MERFNPTIEEGLTVEQVELRKKENLVNYDDQPKTKTVKQIIIGNFFTYFNFLNIGLGLSVFIAGVLNHALFDGIKNCLFMGVIIVNSIISIIEEIISKKIIDKLSVISESSLTVIRNKKEETVKINELVLDDVLKLTLGKQVVCDSILLDGEVEVNESFLTGEPDAIVKKKGDMLLSGSFIVSGTCFAKVEHIGRENYVSKISSEAKYEKKVNSVIMHSFEKLLKILSVLIIPIGIIMYMSQVDATNGNETEAIFTTVASLIGMIPEGLVLLTSSVMAVSVIRLSKYKVLVQQLYCIETLARVNVICLDKTGTLTEGKMEVVDFIPYENVEKEELEKALSLYATYSMDTNETMLALKKRFSKSSPDKVKASLAFSSERKFSGLEFEKKGTYYIGAPEFLLKENVKQLEKVLNQYQEKYRMLVLVKGEGDIDTALKNTQILGTVLIEDVIRKEAKDTLTYFKEQGVEVKIISGDNVKTVLHIASKVGLEKQKGINVGELTEEELRDAVLNYQVFGRVKPEQKKQIIKILQEEGLTVAMTGDGVNDVLALKQSDCAIAVASGSDAARNVAQLVLLNDNFDSLPQIVMEGRRTINNIERSASLLLVKTIYTILLIVFSVLISNKYFFVPIQLTLITTFTIGTPSFILALEPNNEIVKGNFLLKVVSRSLPTAMTVFFNVALVTAFTNVFDLTYELQSSLCVILTAITGFIYLLKICRPFTWIRRTLFFTMLLGFIYCLIFQYSFFNLMPINCASALIAFVLTLASLYVYKKLDYFITYLFHKMDKTIQVAEK